MLNKAVASLIYPAALALVAGGVVTALMTQVVPKIVEQFEAVSADLPLVTEIVIGVSNFLGAYGLYLLIAVLLAGVAFWQGLRNPGFKLAFDRWVLTTPVLGKLLRGLDGARFARTLATLLPAARPCSTVSKARSAPSATATFATGLKARSRRFGKDPRSPPPSNAPRSCRR